MNTPMDTTTASGAEWIGLEAVCSKCGETFNPADEQDLEHLESGDGRECGGRGELTGAWR